MDLHLNSCARVVNVHHDVIDIKKWYVDIGDHVQQGQILADIEAPQIDADLRMAQAQLKLAEANLKLAQTNSARSQQFALNRPA